MEYAYFEESNDVLVEVSPFYIPEKSRPEDSFYFYAYRIKLSSHCRQPFKLIKRFWIIRDGNRQEQRVYGDGVVGQTPMIKPGDTFQYTSYCPLKTETGNMRGSFEMQREDGSTFKVFIPVFFLRKPQTFH